MAGQAIIGRIPGYNSNIDSGGVFEQELKKGVTYIDLYPTAFTDGLDLAAATRSGNAASFADIDLFGAKINQLFTQPGLVKSSPPGQSTGQATGNGGSGDPSYELFKGVLARMKEGFGLDDQFAAVETIRIVAANDSTFTETLSNSFDGENLITAGFNAAKGAVDSIPMGSSIIKGLKSFDSMAMQNMVGAAFKGVTDETGMATLGDLLSGAALGMNIAAPSIWSASQYSSSLTLFVKLVSPTGQEECIKKNILEPLLYLLAAASPITGYGTVYGYPLMWQVNAQGITNFRIGAISSLSIIRGSFETTFTTALQPTVVDVRLSIIPLLTEFAVQTNADNVKNIYKKDMTQYLGVQNPADIVRGTMNTGPAGSRTQTPPNVISVKI